MARGGKRTQATLKWAPHEYSTYNLLNSNKTLTDLRKEYNRLRKIANLRLDRLAKSDFAQTEAYQLNKFLYRKPARDYSRKKLAAKLFEVSKFINAESSSVRGQQRIRRKALKALHAHGYKFVNKSNFVEFGKFMESMRVLLGGKLYDSDRIAEMYAVARNLKVDAKSLEKDFDFWYKHYKELEQLPVLEGEKHSSQEYIRLLKAQKKGKK